jgi:hypothetical protein
MGLVVMLGLSMTAFAQADPQITVNSSQFIYQGVGTGIYYGSVGSTPTNFVCDDFTDEIIPGETWQAAVYNLESVFTGSPPVLFNGITPGHDATTWTQAYAEVAWLAEQIFTNTNQSTGDSLQYAIWYIMDHPTISDPGSGATDAANALSWYNHLSASCQEDPVACGALANLVIYVPISWTGSGQPQELLGTPTPEPLTMLLMGTFLSLVGFGLGKKKLFS